MPRLAFAGAATPTFTTIAVAADATSLDVAVTTGWDFTRPFVVVVDRGLPTEEKILCAAPVTGTTVTVSQRGYDGTSPQAHEVGATVMHVLSSDVVDEAQGHVYDPTVHTREYVHNQSSPQAVWTIDHGLGGHPQVITEDSLGIVFWAEVTYPTPDRVVVYVSPPTSGRATLTI